MAEDKAARWPNCAYCTSGRPHPGCTGHVSPKQPRAGQHCTIRCRPGETCRYHGGAAPQVKAARARREAEREAEKIMTTLGLPIETSPTEALLDEVKWTAGHVRWLRERVQQLEDPDAPQRPDPSPLVWGRKQAVHKNSGEFPGTDTTETAAPSVWYELYTRERQHLVTVCAAALRAGIEERRVQLAEQQGALVADVVRGILDDLLAALIAAGLGGKVQGIWAGLVADIVPRHFRRLAAA